MKERILLTELIVILIFIFFWIGFWVMVWYENGKEYHLDVAKYIHNPPSKLELDLVECLVTQNQLITVNSFSATILDLARKKYIKIEAQQTYS